MDVKEGFDRALDRLPAQRPIEERLVLGRRAVRRRRTALGAAALVGVVAVGGTGWALVPGAGDAVDGSAATSPRARRSCPNPPPPPPPPLLRRPAAGSTR